MTDPRHARVSSSVWITLLLTAMCVIAVGPAYVNHDAAWYLFVVQRWLDGATLYRDIIDTNPPLIIWLSAVPVLLSHATGAGAPAVFKLFVFALAGLSLAAVYRTVRQNWLHHEFVLVGCGAFLCLPFVKGDFGQREHLAVLLTLPYVLSAAAPDGPGPPWLRCVIGLAAGLGFSIKPHFVLAWIAVEGAIAVTRGPRAIRRPEVFAAVATAFAYGAAAAMLAPEYLAVADQVRRVYGGLDSPVSVLLRLREFQLWLVALALFVAIRWPAHERLVGILFAAATGFLAAAALQFKGWGYQLYPARVFLVLFLAAAGAVLLDALPAAATLLRGGRRGLAVVFALVLTVASGRYIAEARHPASLDLVGPFIAAITVHAPTGPFAALSMRTIIYPAFPAVNYTHTPWGLRHNSLWFLPGFYDDQDRQAGGPLEAHALERMPPLERMFFDQIVDDLCAAPPRLLAIERSASSSPAGRRALDLESYYSQSPRAMRLLSGYRPEGAAGPFELLVPTATPSCQ